MSKPVFSDDLLTSARATLDAARAETAMIVTAESCTGGLVGALLTAIPGSSDAVEGGTITYSNEAKVRLGVDPVLLEAHGAVSEEVARAMAEVSAAAVPGRPVSVSITGVAGPGGGSAQKPVGLVHFAAHFDGRTLHRECRFGDIGRDGVREASAAEALLLIRVALNQSSVPTS